jgi:hypothetical protein
MVATGGNMIHLKFPTTFPLVFEFRKYGVTYHRVGYCCGMHHYMLKWLLLIKFGFKNIVSWRCPQCGKLHYVQLSWHIVPFYTKELREENKRLDDFRGGKHGGSRR